MESMEKMSVNYVYLVVLSGNILALVGDASISWPSPVIPKLNNTETNPLDEKVTNEDLTWIAPMSGFGSIVGILPFSFLPDMIGRKPSLLLIALPHMLSFGLSAMARSITVIYIARFFSGISIAACYMVLPMYIAEISENSNRGLMLVSYAIFSNFGCLLTYIAGPLMTMFWFNVFLLVFPVIFFISFSLIAPESPYYFVIKKNPSRALDSLEKLRSNNYYANSEFELRNISEELFNSQKGKIFDTLKKRHAIKGSIIAIMLTTFQQLSGYSVFVPYAEPIFSQAGSSKKISELSSMIIGAVAFFSSFFCPFIIDRKGRRFVLITSLVGIITSELFFGLFYYLSAHNYDMSSVKWMPLVCLIGFMLFFTFGLGPLPLTVTSEILPVNVKFLVTTISGVCGTIASMIMSKNYDYLNSVLGYSGTIWLFAGLCTALLVFVFIFVPETKGKNFSEILEALDK